MLVNMCHIEVTILSPSRVFLVRATPSPKFLTSFGTSDILEASNKKA